PISPIYCNHEYAGLPLSPCNSTVCCGEYAVRRSHQDVIGILRIRRQHIDRLAREVIDRRGPGLTTITAHNTDDSIVGSNETSIKQGVNINCKNAVDIEIVHIQVQWIWTGA